MDYKGIGFLFDCGEGTQRQMNIAGLSRNKIKYICITHWHADHIAGLLGLMQTIQNGADKVEGMQKITLFGPIGTKMHFEHLMKASVFDNRVNIEVKEFDCEKVTIIHQSEEFRVEAINVKHGTPCLAFSLVEEDKRKVIMSKVKAEGIPEGPLIAYFQQGKDITFEGKKFKVDDYTKVEKGKKVSYIVDTCFVNTAIDLAKESDLLLSEATFTEEHDDKADQYSHMTSKQAAQIASMSDSKKLILCHISQRYKITTDLLEEAKEVFPNTEVAFDFMKIVLK